MTHKKQQYNKWTYVQIYILPLNKQGKRILAEYPEYHGLNYPKEKDLKFWRRIDNKKYVEIPAPKFDMEVLNYNRQR